MSLCVLGMAEEFRRDGVAVNALWPRSIIATAALQMIPGADAGRGRKPEILADAAHWILTQPSRAVTGNFFIDEDVLARAGVTDLAPYAVDPAKSLSKDIFSGIGRRPRAAGRQQFLLNAYLDGPVPGMANTGGRGSVSGAHLGDPVGAMPPATSAARTASARRSWKARLWDRSAAALSLRLASPLVSATACAITCCASGVRPDLPTSK